MSFIFTAKQTKVPQITVQHLRLIRDEVDDAVAWLRGYAAALEQHRDRNLLVAEAALLTWRALEPGALAAK